jgi:hypothetical protein
MEAGLQHGKLTPRKRSSLDSSVCSWAGDDETPLAVTA